MELLSLLCLHPESSYLIRVVGDSMIDAGILSGDIVIVDKSNRNPTPKEIAVCELNGEYTLKHFVEENGRGWLLSYKNTGFCTANVARTRVNAAQTRITVRFAQTDIAHACA